jgi:hypothetical protein
VANGYAFLRTTATYIEVNCKLNVSSGVLPSQFIFDCDAAQVPINSVSVDTKSMAMVEREQRGVNIVIDGEIIQQVSTFKYLGRRMSVVEMNADLEENIGNYNKLNGCINRHFGKSERRDIKQRLQNLVSKPALKCASDTWVLRSRNKDLRLVK